MSTGRANTNELVDIKLVRPSVMPTKYCQVEAIVPPTAPPDNELSIFRVVKEVLSSVKPGSDVTNINLPASVLDPVSTLEKTKKSMQRGELLQDVCDPKQDALSRFFSVMRFNISGLARERFGKKPYNPVLGELYRCCFVHRGSGGVTLLVAEQVSHHPPITALHLRNDTLGFTMNSHTAPEPRFWGNSLEVKLTGFIRIQLDRFGGEEYIITRPCISMTGFIAGRQRLEFTGMSSFKCEKTGLGAEIEYKAKSTMTYRSDINAITGRVYEMATNKTLYTLEGHWDKTVKLTNVETQEEQVLFDYDSIVLEKSMVAVLPDDETLEESFSTCVWNDCSRAILAGESIAANAEKRKVEEYQRRLKKERAAANIEWEHHYFSPNDNDGREHGWDLRKDLKEGSLVNLSISKEELNGLTSGQLVNKMVEHVVVGEDGDCGNGEGGRKGLLRRKFLSRR